MNINLCRALPSLLFSLTLFVGLLPHAVKADDTEIYQAEFSVSTGARPKVLIVFDDSGSMATMVDQQRPAYDPEEDYERSVPNNRIYWSTDGSVPSRNSDNWFSADRNRCASSWSLLESEGKFTTDRARRWVDSRVEEGDCYWGCPQGQSYRRENRRWGCYEYVTTTEEQTSCVTDERRVSEQEYDAWLANGGEGERRCVRGFLFFCLEYGYFIREESCTTETVTTSEWVYRQDRQYICESNTVIPGAWQALSDDVNNPTHVECLNDVTGGLTDNGSGVGSGFPQAGVANGSEFGPSPDPSVEWGGQAYTFYTSHYMNWYHDDSLVEARSRLDIAQDVISGIIRTNPGIDFGLMEFNYDDGGRVVRRIIEDMSADERSQLVDMVNRIDHAGSTPICESMYEAYRYLSGDTVYYGNDSRSGGDGNGVYDVLSRDTRAERNGRYLSPTTDCAYTYVILMTDGFPQRDTGANNRIETLTGKRCKRYRDADGDNTTNCLPELAEYMANTDLDGDDTNGNQFGITYTIGFTTDQELLSDAAEKGKGEYYTANNAQELTEAFQGAIVSILSTDTTFTSPAVAVDTFTRTQSRDEIFYAMFKPGDSVNWPGNIKKLKLQTTDGEAVLVDANGAPAIDPSTGFIKDTAVTFWGNSQDGGLVEEGGVGALLAARDPASRSLYINTGSGGDLESLVPDNITADAFGVGSDAELYARFGVSSSGALTRQINWARGYDAYDQDGDGNTDDRQRWVLGDILHSQPLVLNYGARGGFTEDSPDLRLVVGTNAGFVHMFGADDGAEDWAFFPKELAHILQLRRRDALSSDNIYGMDLTPTAYTLDVDADGTLDSGDGDKAWVFLGMRRGGYAYYALDVSNPESPEFLWTINPDSSGFAELGQTWSQPVVTHIPGYADNDGVAKPVLIFGAGYDTGKDGSGPASPDSRGRGLYIVDAETGSLVWSVTPAANSATNLRETGLVHSVAAPVTTLDSNGDELTDRIYFADTGGNVWRVDLAGNALPTGSQETWQINKLASLNRGGTSTDRRFFNAPDVVRIRFDGRPVDAVLIGSGDRTNPNATDVDNRFYMIRDYQISPYTGARPSTADCGGDSAGDNRCLLPYTDTSFYDITSNLLNSEQEDEQTAALEGLRSANGWRLDLGGDGEKVLAKSLTLDGTVYVTTFTPNNLLDDINVCEPNSGSGRLYAIDLFNGGRYVMPLGPIIPDTPSVHFGDDGRIRLLLPPGAPPGGPGGDDPGGDRCEGGVCDIDLVLRPPYGIHWFQEQYR
ncbi:pilus assembly protein [Haliea atlantica]